jgi:hypothetical protein
MPEHNLQSNQDNTLELKKAYEDIKSAEELAEKTGVQYSNGYEDEHQPYAHPDTVKYGVRQGPVTVDRFQVDGIATNDAFIASEGSAGHIKLASSHEKTGTYQTDQMFNEGSTDGNVYIQRDDGKGDIYEGRITASNGEKATAIIASRAAKKVKRAIVDRAISMAEELKQEK